MKNQINFHVKNAVSPLKLVELSSLRPIEKVMPTHLQYITNLIEQTGYINKPLIIENQNNIILDGSHRYAYLKSFGYKYAPVIIVDYASNQVDVGSNLIHRFINKKDSTISKGDVINKALSNQLFEPRSTRHFFPFKKDDIPTKLEKLFKTNKCCINYLISKTTIEEEIVCNQNYIKEIENELKIIDRHTQEQIQTKTYLQNQISNMKKKIKTNLL